MRMLTGEALFFGRASVEFPRESVVPDRYSVGSRSSVFAMAREFHDLLR
jgi:hypothetical protein